MADIELVIKIPERIHYGIEKGITVNGSKASQILIDAVKNGTLLPTNATNGDVIKALFPNARFDNAMPFTDNRWETMNLDTENETRAIYKPTQLRTYADWWNAPYKRGSEK